MAWGLSASREVAAHKPLEFFTTSQNWRNTSLSQRYAEFTESLNRVAIMVTMTDSKKRRPKGDGSLFQTVHNNRIEYCAAWFDANHKKHRTYGLTKTEALVKKQKLISKLAIPPSEQPRTRRTTLGTASNPTVEQFMDRWLKNRTTLSDVVRRQYKMNLSNHVIPIIGKKALRRLSDTDITAVMESMKIRNIGKAATAHTLKQLNTMLNYAVKMKLLNRNPCEYVDLPSVRPAVRHLDNELLNWRTSTFQNILDELKDPANKYHDDYLRVLLMGIGLRGSELVGLTWDCFNIPDKTLTIRQQQKKEKGGEYYIAMNTKNKHERVIPLPPLYCKALAEEMMKSRKQNKPIKTDDGRTVTNCMFLHEDGSIITYHWHFDRWKLILTEYLRSEGRSEEQIKQLVWRPHYNRHIAASIMARNRVPLTTAQQILGHLDKEMTEWYTHAYQEDIREAAETLAQTYEQDPWQFAKQPVTTASSLPQIQWE